MDTFNTHTDVKISVPITTHFVHMRQMLSLNIFKNYLKEGIGVNFVIGSPYIWISENMKVYGLKLKFCDITISYK